MRVDDIYYKERSKLYSARLIKSCNVMLQRIVSRIDHVDMVQQYKRKDVISLEAVVALSLMDDSTVDCRLDSIKEENLIIKKWLRRAHGREKGKEKNREQLAEMHGLIPFPLDDEQCIEKNPYSDKSAPTTIIIMRLIN